MAEQDFSFTWAKQKRNPKAGAEAGKGFSGQGCGALRKDVQGYSRKDKWAWWKAGVMGRKVEECK